MYSLMALSTQSTSDLSNLADLLGLVQPGIEHPARSEAHLNSLVCDINLKVMPSAEFLIDYVVKQEWPSFQLHSDLQFDRDLNSVFSIGPLTNTSENIP